MIAPQELRLGNYVKYRGSIYKVLSIVNTSNTKEESYYVDLNFVHRHLKGIDTREVEPIYLNEDWLLKLGFEKTTPDGWLCLNICNDWTFLYWNKGLLELSVNRHSVVLKNVIHVHQLQNLTFALTGEELKIKES